MAGPRIFVDADACPVKEETYKVARRYGLKVFVVANAFIMVPAETLIERVIVDAGPDIADDWIADECAAGRMSWPPPSADARQWRARPGPSRWSRG